MRRLILALALGGGLIAAPSAGAATITVTRTDDPVGFAGSCPGAGCTLRAALTQAQSNLTDADTIVLAGNSTYSLTSALTLNFGAQNISIAGAGANSTVITQTGADRVINTGGNSGLALRDVTLQHGRPASGAGGDMQVGSQASLTLVHVRLTDGQAAQGGGMAIMGSSRVDIASSLIDTNTATGTNTTDLGGGIYLQGQTFATTLNVQDSTITANAAQVGGGFGLTNNIGGPVTFTGVTIARNSARGVLTGGGLASTSGAAGVQVQNSIVAANTAAGAGAGPPFQTASNCRLVSGSTDLGGNVETGTDCGLAGHQNTDPQLAALDITSAPPVIPIPATSPAVDIASCPGIELQDQRGVARPQGPRCDAGAFEYQPPAAPTPTPTPTATASPTPAPSPTATPTPAFRQTVVVAPVKGRVLVRRAGSTQFVELDAATGVPVGSTLDTRKGTVALTSQAKPGAAPQSADFFDGIFKVTQSTKTTDLRLTEALAACPTAGKAAAAARKPKQRRLWGDGSGSFRTEGRYSAATVRGTKWLVEDSCQGTLTRVTRGVVSVRDNVRKRNITVRAGKKYIARPRAR